MPAECSDRNHVGILAERGWLSLTSPAFRGAVLQRLSIHKFDTNEPIYRLDDPAGGLWSILNGVIEAEMPGPAGPLLGHCGAPGFWFGEGTVIFSSQRRAGVFATCPSTLAHLSIADCHSVLAADPSGWRWIALLSTMTTDLAMRLAADLLLRDPEQQTAAMLLRLAGLRNGMFLKPHQVPIHLSHEKLGQLVNLSRNAIGPILKSFEKKGYLTVAYRSIDIQDAAGLAALLAR
jgi:CRP/FNR family transcriptional regulator, cyclic AMP receptor protein